MRHEVALEEERRRRAEWWQRLWDAPVGMLAELPGLGYTPLQESLIRQAIQEGQQHTQTRIGELERWREQQLKKEEERQEREFQEYWAGRLRGEDIAALRGEAEGQPSSAEGQPLPQGL